MPTGKKDIAGRRHSVGKEWRAGKTLPIRGTACALTQRGKWFRVEADVRS